MERYMRPAPGDLVTGLGWERSVIRNGVLIGTVGILSVYRGLARFYSTDGSREFPAGCESYLVPTLNELIAKERAERVRAAAAPDTCGACGSEIEWTEHEGRCPLCA
jgi:hypothetical protein